MNEFIDYILQFQNLNQQQIDFISSKATKLKIAKDDYFCEAGKIPRQVGFLVKGIFRICYYNSKGEDITKYFIEESNIVADYFNFKKQLEASIYLQAVTDCELLVFSRQNWENTATTIVGWETIVDKMIQNYLLQKVKRRSSLVEQDGRSRYLEFIKDFPTLVNRVPLAYIASFIGVTQSSLSRIRKNIR
ncbi:Crp/Fnr family transcriptional regulator [Pedobacter psychroterrae]|uniref:Crp/Fnr family transcriptional regulator n=1 Tax=Pedobacter psychroterrae TaxID=2530453 RepID=A0A4R0NQQ0_9SPHI|nr:Crp/Fnr family transcriptional regulator [Pedobacter psychroterrae]TCD03136.1 Crp/Fnr family transcriptional regulator [Pedobacter psychroterrae]